MRNKKISVINNRLFKQWQQNSCYEKNLQIYKISMQKLNMHKFYNMQEIQTKIVSWWDSNSSSVRRALRRRKTAEPYSTTLKISITFL